MAVDWTQFREGDRILVELTNIVGVWNAESGRIYEDGGGRVCAGVMARACHAELIKRPFTPPDAGKLFRNASLWISEGERGYRLVRMWDNTPVRDLSTVYPWHAMAPEWLADIEVLDA